MYGSHRQKVDEGEGTDHEELGRMFDDAAAILDGEEPAARKAATEGQSKPGSQNS